jgi:cytochrome c peroxidase
MRWSAATMPRPRADSLRIFVGKGNCSACHSGPQFTNGGFADSGVRFRVPGLRNVARTAPYMHNGSLATLRDAVRHYSELNEERLHADGEKILKPLRLSEQEVVEVVTFLESLTAK